MPFNIGAPELIIILIIALVVLGPGKLPDVAASLGKSLREFRKAATDVQDAAKVDAPAPNPAAPAQASRPAPSAAEAKPPAEAGATPPATADAPASNSSQS
jgi:TatA/E family protein of Tat protein translocase